MSRFFDKFCLVYERLFWEYGGACIGITNGILFITLYAMKISGSWVLLLMGLLSLICGIIFLFLEPKWARQEARSKLMLKELEEKVANYQNAVEAYKEAVDDFEKSVKENIVAFKDMSRTLDKLLELVNQKGLAGLSTLQGKELVKQTVASIRRVSELTKTDEESLIGLLIQTAMISD